MEAALRGWLAGFFEGEGNLGCWTRGGLPYVRVQIVQKDRAVLDDIQGVLGYGSITRFTSGVHCFTIKGGHCLQDFLTLIVPYCRFKRAKVETALELLELSRCQPGRRVSDDVRLRRFALADELRVRAVA